MQISSVRIANYRCFTDETVRFSNYSTLVGANNSGKSTVIRALNAFFETKGGRRSPFDSEDFYANENNERTNALCIEVTLNNLSDAARAEFHEYVQPDLLKIRLHGFRFEDGTVQHRFAGVKLGMTEFRRAFELSSETPIAPFNTEFARLCATYPEIDPEGEATNKTAKLTALREFERSRPEDCVEIESTKNMSGAVSPIPKLEKYITWVFIPAIKDASDEAKAGANALTKLLKFYVASKSTLDERLRTIRDNSLKEVNEAYADHQGVIGEISTTLSAEIRRVSTGDVGVRLELGSPEEALTVSLPDTFALLTDRNVAAHPSKFGHGLQRNFLYAILSIVGKEDTPFFDNENRPKLILAFEEPELFHHPVQKNLLAADLENLSRTAQIITATHSAAFVSSYRMEDILFCRIVQDQSKVFSTTVSEVSRRVCHALAIDDRGAQSAVASLESALSVGVKDLFFATSIVVVEGIEDKAFIEKYVEISHWHEEAIKYGTLVVPAGGKFSAIAIAAVAISLSLPCFIIFDGDLSHRDCKKKSKNTIRDNKAFQRLVGIAEEDHLDFFEEDTYSDYFIAWAHDIKHSCVSSQARLQDHLTDCKAVFGSKTHKHPLVIREAVQRCFAEDLEIEPLQRLISRIIENFSENRLIP